MEKILNLVFYNDIKKFLVNERFHFMVIQKENNYYLKELDLSFNGYNSILKNYLCYNYDLLSDYNKVFVKDKVVSFKQLNNNVYKKNK